MELFLQAIGLGLALAFLLPSITKTRGSISLSRRFHAAHAAVDPSQGAGSSRGIRPGDPVKEGSVLPVAHDSKGSHGTPEMEHPEKQVSSSGPHAGSESHLSAEDGWPHRVDGGRLGLTPALPSLRPFPLGHLNQPTIQYAFDVMMEQHPTT